MILGRLQSKSAYAGVVTPKDLRKTVVSLDTARSERGHRVEREEAKDGTPAFTLVIPTPGAPTPEDRFRIDVWTKFPGVAEPFAHALLDTLRNHSTRASRITALQFASYFARFLTDTLKPDECSNFRLSELTTAVANSFIKWLDRIDQATGKAALAVATRKRHTVHCVPLSTACEPENGASRLTKACKFVMLYGLALTSKASRPRSSNSMNSGPISGVHCRSRDCNRDV